MWELLQVQLAVLGAGDVLQRGAAVTRCIACAPLGAASSHVAAHPPLGGE
jgi:hypothetical protein